jgi:GNAT superfamily N-acetyltransferase
MSQINVRPIAPQDRGDWDTLYAAYAAFYEIEQTQEMRDRVWGWLFDPAASSEALVAENAQGMLIGLAHFRPYARPLAAATGGFLDDLFVSPTARGSGAAQALIEALEHIAAQRGWGVIRWITADNNYRARGLYDRVATRTSWVTYDIKL